MFSILRNCGLSNAQEAEVTEGNLDGKALYQIRGNDEISELLKAGNIETPRKIFLVKFRASSLHWKDYR